MYRPGKYLKTKKPVDPDLADLLNGVISSTAEAIQQNNNSGHITASGKSAKLLNGVNRHSVQAWSGRSIRDPIPETFVILDSNENATTKFQAMEDKLLYAQRINSWVKFTLRNQTVSDMSKHLFQFEPDEKHMMRGFTPFCLQKMEKSVEIELQLLEEKMENTTFTSLSDLTKKESVLQFSPITDSSSFLTAIANTHALAWCLFSNSSPLTQDLYELFKIMLDAHHDGDLQNTGEFQTNWYAHALWGLYQAITKFFRMRLTEYDLRRGARLINPLTTYIQDIKKFGMYLRPKVPAVLLTTTADHQETTAESPAGKRKPGEDAKEAKKLRWLKLKEQRQLNWKENKKFDATLKATKQKITSTHPRANMGAVLRAHGLGIPDALKKIGIPLSTCGRFSLWGGCGDPACKLKHDDNELTATQVSIANEILSDGAEKLKKPKQD